MEGKLGAKVRGVERKAMRVLLCLAAASLLHGAETKIERGKKIVEASLAALGGDNFVRVTDRVESGRAYSFYREQMTGLPLPNHDRSSL